jgi:hypothetical protein
MGTESNNLVALERARVAARARLGEGYAHDLLDADELDRRLDALEQAATTADVAVLVDDLAAPVAVIDPAVGPTEAPSLALVPLDQVAPAARIRAYFAETKRVGPWMPARDNEVRAVFASVRLDLREAQLAPGVTHFAVDVVMAELELIVPPGLPVDVECSALFGEVDQDEAVSGTPMGSDARIRVTGRVWFGSISVREQQIGESKSEARKRRKAERKRLTEEKRRKMLGPAR